MTPEQFSRRSLFAAALAVGSVAVVGCSSLSPSQPLLDPRGLLAGKLWRLDHSGLGRADYSGPGARPAGTVQLLMEPGGPRPRISLPRTSPVDMTSNSLKLWFFIPQGDLGLREINVQVGSGSAAFDAFTYQSVQLMDTPNVYGAEYIKPGAWTSITVGPASFASGGAGRVDFTRVQDFLIEAAAFPNHSAELLFGGMEIFENAPVFRKGVVSLAFDDGLASAYDLGRDILSARSASATLYLIHDLIGQRGYLTPSQVSELVELGWEIGGHANTAEVHNAPGGFTSVSDAALIQDWSSESSWLRQLSLDVRHLAYPQGVFDERVLDLVRKKSPYLTARTLNYRSIETLPPADPLRLRTIYYDSDTALGSVDQIGTIAWRLREIARNGGWLILTFHDIVGSNPTGTQIGTDVLTSTLDAIAEQSLEILPVGKVWNEI